MLLALVTLSLLGDVAPGPIFAPARPPAPQCAADSDCVLSTWNGCCGSCCATEPHAIPRGTQEGQYCASVDCKQPDCAAVRCAAPPDQSQFVAACRSRRCVVARKGESAQCRTNADCRAVTMAPPPAASCHRSPCGCCPVTQAIPADGVVPLQKRPADPKAPKQPSGKPDFGLSTGGPPPPQAPNCSPCPAPAGGTALCEQGRCILVDVPPRIPPAG